MDRTVGDAYQALRSPDDAYPDYPVRLTYVIDPDGTIARSYAVTDTAAHPDEVLADLRGLVGST